MATGVDPKNTNDNFDDLLKCMICLDVFKDPKYLPCHHTFCKLCIHTYVDSFTKRKEKIPCPICRNPITSRNSSDDTESIVDRLPNNNFVVYMLDKQTITERQCSFCIAQGKQNKAVFWCGVCQESYCDLCLKIHKSNKLLSMHKIVSVKDTQNKTTDLIETMGVFCDDHRERIVEVYCVDHKKACCTLCATLFHRKCDKVISIEEAATGIKQNGELTNLLFKLRKFEVLLTEVINCRNENKDTFDTESTNIETAVTKIIRDMKNHLDKIQSKTLSELEAAKKQTSMKVTDDINDFTSYKSAVTNLKTMLIRVVKHGSEQQCLVIQNEVASKIEKLEDEIKNAMTNIRNASARFKISALAEEFNEKVTSIGEFSIEESKLKVENGKLSLFRSDFRNGEIRVIRTINVATAGYVSAIFLDGQMVCTAYNTKKMIKYNQDGELLGELTIPTCPTDICHFSETRVVVSSYPDVLYIVDCNNMTLHGTIKLTNNVNVWGICVYDNNQFLVGSNTNQLSCIEQSSGTKTKSITTSGYSCYVSTSVNNDYLYGDGINSATYVVNKTKKFTYTHTQLSSPYGNGIDNEGNFYIAGYGSNNIHQITDTGELIRIIPASTVGIQQPWSIRFEKGSNRFLVTSATGKASLCCID